MGKITLDKTTLETVDIRLLPGEHVDVDKIAIAISGKLNCPKERLPSFHLLRRSIDARKQPVQYQLRFGLGERECSTKYFDRYVQRENAPSLIIIGAGPAGYFAALEAIELGLRPIVLDRGKDVRARRRDLKAIQQHGIVNSDSNYCFGEGGAGTYSDGKLYTRSGKRGNIEKVLRIFVEHGAPAEILIDAHPHIGTNKLPGIVGAMRETIIKFGGEVYFESRVTDILVQDGKFVGVVVNDKEEFKASYCVLATGHSARDIYHLFDRHKWAIIPKPFALGVRVEHRQELIDEIQYKMKKRGEHLPPSSYSLVCQSGGRGVFSFCMCPGGLVVPSATSPGEIVLNGMSPSRRDSLYSNSGIVVAVENEDLGSYQHYGALSNMYFQQSVEQKMFSSGDGSQRAPALRLLDFVKRRMSDDLPSNSYIPGLFPAPLFSLLPSFISDRLIDGFRQFGHRMPAYLTNEAVVIATESRTSAPVQIPRDPDTLMHPDIHNLFPCGEGAGYAGGIVSAAMDGMKVVSSIYKLHHS
jgi:uncharacterized FAD-dependent dehydrogenase